MRLVIGLAGMIVVSVALQQGRAQSPEKPLAVSLCEVKAHPENFLHKLIEFTATASHGFEDSMVEDSQCPWPNGGPGVWMEYGGTRSTDTMYCCGFSPKPDRAKTLVVDGMSLDLVDDETFKEFDKRLHPQHSKPKRGPTLSGLLCVAEYLQGTKALVEHSRILAGGDMATWAAVCCSSSRRWFRLTHLADLTGRQLRTWHLQYGISS